MNVLGTTNKPTDQIILHAMITPTTAVTAPALPGTPTPISGTMQVRATTRRMRTRHLGKPHTKRCYFATRDRQTKQTFFRRRVSQTCPEGTAVIIEKQTRQEMTKTGKSRNYETNFPGMNVMIRHQKTWEPPWEGSNNHQPAAPQPTRKSWILSQKPWRVCKTTENS